MDKHWILDADHHLVPVDLLTWARWFEDFSNRQVAETFTEHFRVSTVFLGIDHRFIPDGPPIVFETMIFPIDGPLDEEYMWRYSSWDDAVTGHAVAVKKALTLTQA